MNAKQTKLIEQAATVETDGDGWRKRMERWLGAIARPALYSPRLIMPGDCFDGIRAGGVTKFRMAKGVIPQEWKA